MLRTRAVSGVGIFRASGNTGAGFENQPDLDLARFRRIVQSPMVAGGPVPRRDASRLKPTDAFRLYDEKMVGIGKRRLCFSQLVARWEISLFSRFYPR